MSSVRGAASRGKPSPVPEPGPIADWLRRVLPENGLVEVRATGPTSCTFFGADEPDRIAREMVRLTNKGATAVYWTLNPTTGDARKDGATKDIHVPSRRLLLVDLDPHRPNDTSATDAEKEAARSRAVAVRDFLHGRGWPDPVFADSGNGYHLVYRIDLPNDDAARELVKAVLAALADRFDDSAVEVDRRNFNAARICKAWGTVARKGEPTADRPHRVGGVAEMPDELAVVGRDMLDALSTSAKPAAPAPPRAKGIRARALPDPIRAYVNAAVADELNEVIAAPQGQRNDTLNRAAFKLGTLVGAGVLSEGQVIAGLVGAGLMAGPDEAKIRSTVVRAIADGREKPRDLSGVGKPPLRVVGADAHTKNGSLGDGSGALGSLGDGSGALEGSPRLPKYPKAPNPPNDPGYGSLSDEDFGLLDLSTVTPKEVRWLLKNRIPLGKVSLLAGEGGLGKTFVMLSIAAGISTGGECPGGEGERYPLGDVIILTAEDDPEDALAPRLLKMGADMTRVFVLQTAKLPSGDRVPVSLGDIERLRDAIRRRPDTRMIFVDPIPSFLGRGIDDSKNAELRLILDPLAEFAAEYGIAIVGVTHFNKSASAKAAQRVMGSVAYSNVARACWCLVEDPETEGRRLLLPVKNNYSPDRNNGLAFTITDGRVVWEAEGVRTPINDVLSGCNGATPADKRARAVAFLKELLTGQLYPSDEVIAKAKEKGFGKNLIWEVKEAAGVRAEKAGFSGKWKWTIDAGDVPAATTGRGIVARRVPYHGPEEPPF